MERFQESHAYFTFAAGYTYRHDYRLVYCPLKIYTD